MAEKMNQLKSYSSQLQERLDKLMDRKIAQLENDAEITQEQLKKLQGLTATSTSITSLSELFKL